MKQHQMKRIQEQQQQQDATKQQQDEDDDEEDEQQQQQQLQRHPLSPDNVLILPLYGALSLEQQQLIFEPTPLNTRKIIVSSPIAETSLTIDGIVFVIDSCLCKESIYDPESNTDCLLPILISKASAEQRAGRSGRTMPGKCFRMLTRDQYQNLLPPQSYPEIQRCDITDTVLTLLRIGVKNIVKFPFIDAPAPQSLANALQKLMYLGAITENGDLTVDGYKMSELPVDVCSSKMILESAKFRCTVEACAIAALLQTSSTFGPSQIWTVPFQKRELARSAIRSEFYRVKVGSSADSRTFAFHESDHFAMLQAFRPVLNQHTTFEERHRYCFDKFISFSAMLNALKAFEQLCKIVEGRVIRMELTSNYLRVENAFGNNTNLDSMSNLKSNNNNNNIMTVVEKIKKCVFGGFFVNTAWRNNSKLMTAKATKNLAIQQQHHHHHHRSQRIQNQNSQTELPELFLQVRTQHIGGITSTSSSSFLMMNNGENNDENGDFIETNNTIGRDDSCFAEISNMSAAHKTIKSFLVFHQLEKSTAAAMNEQQQQQQQNQDSASNNNTITNNNTSASTSMTTTTTALANYRTVTTIDDPSWISEVLSESSQSFFFPDEILDADLARELHRVLRNSSSASSTLLRTSGISGGSGTKTFVTF